MNKFLNFARSAVMTAGVSLAAMTAQAEEQYFSQNLIVTNTVFSAGATNPAANNLALDGTFISLHGLGLGQSIEIELECGQYIGSHSTYIAQYATNCVLTFVPVFDDLSFISKDALATNAAVTVSVTVPSLINVLGNITNNGTASTIPLVTNVTTSVVSLAATNFLGAKGFMLYSVNYQGTNQIGIKRLRAGAGWVVR
jgi:hypothetical protein